MSNKGKLLGFGALGLALLASSKKASSKNVVQDVAPVAFSGNDTQLEELINLIKNNGAIRTLLKGEKGDSVKGDIGETGLAGNQIQNYGGSLIKNGSFENGNKENWANQSLITLILEGGKYIASVLSGVIYTTSSVWVNTDRIYSLSFYHKNSDSISPFLICQKSDGTNAVDAPIDTQSYFNATINSSDFVKYEKYISGIGSVATNFRQNTAKTAICFNIPAGKSLTIKDLIFREIPLGEPVPHNLPYLPINQTVLNNTTGKVGIYNGTTVDYYF